MPAECRIDRQSDTWMKMNMKTYQDINKCVCKIESIEPRCAVCHTYIDYLSDMQDPTD